MFETISDIKPDTQPKRFQCRHIHADGRRCGSPALRSEELCYFHHTSRRPAENPRARRSRQATFDLHLPDATDRTGLQLAIADVLRRIAANQVDPRRAGLLLYGLQIASLNLPSARAAALPTQPSEPVDEIVLDPALGPLAPPAELGHDTPESRRLSLTELLLADIARGEAEMAQARMETADTHAQAEDTIALPGPEARPYTSQPGQPARNTPLVPHVLPSLQASAACRRLAASPHRRVPQVRRVQCGSEEQTSGPALARSPRLTRIIPRFWGKRRGRGT